MPAPAVIPAPRAYITVAAVKELVVGFRGRGCVGVTGGLRVVHDHHSDPRPLHLVGMVAGRSRLHWRWKPLSE